MRTARRGGGIVVGLVVLGSAALSPLAGHPPEGRGQTRAPAACEVASARLVLDWSKEMLTIRGEGLPGGEVTVWYLEAFCRAGSTDRAWEETVIPHSSELIERAEDGSRLVVRSTLKDGVVVTSTIETDADAVRFDVEARNPTTADSDVHWAQPCIRVDRFVGVEAKHGSDEYLPKCFVFVDGEQRFLPTEPWATEARYVPGQVWCPTGVPRTDVNPRPLSAIVPSNGLIGCVSADGSKLLATAWEPYQELFQGVIVCVHSDFRIGGLKAGETKRTRGKIYITDNDVNGLVERYRRDFSLAERE